jgi:c-di-GMP-binding flagellar brake protein YcgR
MIKNRIRSHNLDIPNDVPAMAYSKYLYAGQKVVLKRVQTHGSDNKFDSISGTLAECHESLVEIKLHYGTEEEEIYPFFPGMPFEILADCFGLGLRFTCTFECLRDKSRIFLNPQGDLEFFFRREHLRAPVTLWVSCERSTKVFRTLRRTWKKHTELLPGDNSIAELLPISKQNISLGGGGLQIKLKSPVIVPELCLIYMALEDKGPLVCALCETVWVDPPNDTGHQNTGMEFRSILDSDRQRIIKIVKRHQQKK